MVWGVGDVNVKTPFQSKDLIRVILYLLLSVIILSS